MEGIGGGLPEKSYNSQELDFRDYPSLEFNFSLFGRTLLFGIQAAFTVPFFLELVSLPGNNPSLLGTLLDTCSKLNNGLEGSFVFAGFCIVAAMQMVAQEVNNTERTVVPRSLARWQGAG